MHGQGRLATRLYLGRWLTTLSRCREDLLSLDACWLLVDSLGLAGRKQLRGRLVPRGAAWTGPIRLTLRWRPIYARLYVLSLDGLPQVSSITTASKGRMAVGSTSWLISRTMSSESGSLRRLVT